MSRCYCRPQQPISWLRITQAHDGACSRIFITVLFVIRSQRPGSCPSLGDWIGSSIMYRYIIGYYAAFRSNGQMSRNMNIFKNVVHGCVLSHFSYVQLFVTLWTVACQASLSMGSSRQECWSGLPSPPTGDFPDPETELPSVTISCISRRVLYHQHPLESLPAV